MLNKLVIVNIDENVEKANKIIKKINFDSALYLNNNIFNFWGFIS